MTEVPLHRVTVLFVLLVLCVMGSCTSVDHHRAPTNNCASTGKGERDHNAPVVCIDGSGDLKAEPHSVRVWNVSSADRRTRPVIHWMTKPAGQNLLIEMKDDGCVETPQCNGHGHCSAKIHESIGTEHAEGVEIKRCAYKITFNNRVLDPDTIIVGCCNDPE